MAIAESALLNPVSEEAEARKKEAKKHWDTINKAGALVNVNSLRIGFHAAVLKSQNLFGLLGFESEKDAQQASGVKESTWFNVIRIAESFPGVSEELFTGMKLSNAQALTDLPESKRLTEYWLRKAATEPVDIFQLQIDDEMNGKAKPSDGRERSTNYKLTMPVSRKKVVEEGLQEYAKEVGARDESEALEKLVIEHKEGVSLIGTITRAVEKIAELKKLGETGVSAAEALEKVYAGLDEVVETFRASLQSVQNLENPG